MGIVGIGHFGTRGSKIIKISLKQPPWPEAGARTSVDMDGTLKIGNYRVGGLKNPLALLKPNMFFEKNNDNTFLCIHAVSNYKKRW